MTRKSENTLSTLLAIGAVMTSVLMAGCPPINSGKNQPKSTKSANALTSGGPGFSPGPTAGSNSLQIINATVYSGSLSTPPAPGATPSPAASSSAGSKSVALYFNSSAGTGTNVTSVCTAGSSTEDNSLPCLCRFSWQEVNPRTGVGYTRTAETTVAQPQPFTAACPAPDVWDSEIPEGARVSITMVPDTRNGNTTAFSTNTFQITKQSSSTDTGDFRDSEGRAFKNIFHYVCYDYFAKALRIDHATLQGPTRSSGGSPVTPPQVPLANSFQSTGVDYTAQSYWYDFYVRSSEVGSINQGAPGYTCPKVRIAKGREFVTQYYPLDSTFALALQRSNTYSVAVQANTSINPGATSGAANQGVIGYAAPPNADGTCPAFADSSGLTRRTFRLRRYTIHYPLRYRADGVPLEHNQRINTIYVMDRPVDKSGQDPMKPLTRLGPKPCPGSFNTNFSATTALGTVNVSHACMVGASKLPYNFSSGYHFTGGATTTSSLVGLPNVMPPFPFLYGLPDGKKFGITAANANPATARGNARTYCLANGTRTGHVLRDDASHTCSLGAPVFSDSLGQMYDYVSPKNIDGTVITGGECPIFPPPAANLTSQAALHIRPVRGVVAEWLEDTSFKACAFQPSTPVDPDIVVAYNGHSYPQPGDRATDDPKRARGFYCARTYPDPAWMQREGTTATKLPGNCDSGRPHAKDESNNAYNVPKNDTTEGERGYIDFSATPNRRTVPDGIVSAYAIMNERTYACAFTYNPAANVKYDPTLPLSELITPRSGCCQRASGASKTGTAAPAAPYNTAENRGIHSLVTATGPWYNKYGKPAFTMQSVLLSAAPYQLSPNRGSLGTSGGCWDPATRRLVADCNAVSSNTNNQAVGGHAIVSGDWAGETSDTNNAFGCYDPSEDP